MRRPFFGLLLLTSILFFPSIVFSQAASDASETQKLGGNLKATIYLPSSGGGVAAAREAIKTAFEEGRQTFRDLDARSSGEVARINNAAGKGLIAASEGLLKLLRVCLTLSQVTEGLFDIVWSRSKTDKEPELQVSFEKSQVALPEKGTYLDFEGVLLGFVVDRMAGRLKSGGVEDFLIRAGPVVRVGRRDGADIWRLSVPDPSTGRQTLCRVSLESGSVVMAEGSGSVRSKRKKEGPASDLRSVTVVARNATNAMALARTAVSAGREKARAIFSRLPRTEIGAVLQDSQGKIETLGDVTAACFGG